MATRSSRQPKKVAAVEQPREVRAEDLASVPQLAEIPIAIPQLTWPDGSPFEVTIRALSFEERRAVNRAATKAAEGLPTPMDPDTWALETVFRGLVKPKLTESQKQFLKDTNATVIDDLADAIVRIGRLPARAVERAVERLAAVDGGAAPGTPVPDQSSE